MFSWIKIRKLLALVTILGSATFYSCTKSNVGKSQESTGSSVYAKPETIIFNASNYVYMLRYTYQNFLKSPPQEDLDAIANAPDDDEAQRIYEEAIDKFVDSDLMRERLRQYGSIAIGVGIQDPRERFRYPENLFAKVILSGDQMSELILATYNVRDNGSLIAAQPYEGVTMQDSPPVSDLAGYITMQEFISLYSNQFKFPIIREVFGLNLCSVAPHTKLDIFAWTAEQVNVKYTEGGGVSCITCHDKMNPARGAFHGYIGEGVGYTVNPNQGNAQYGSEAIDPGKTTLEPRLPNGSAMDENVAEATMYKLVPDGPAVLTPRALSQEIIKLPQFASCWTERLLSILLNIDEGYPGPGYKVPDNFSENETQQEYLQKWTEKFNELNQVPKEFIREFLKDDSYIILSYDPLENN